MFHGDLASLFREDSQYYSTGAPTEPKSDLAVGPLAAGVASSAVALIAARSAGGKASSTKGVSTLLLGIIDLVFVTVAGVK